MRCTIYTLTDPRTDEVRYVGMTSRTVEVRVREHLRDGRVPSAPKSHRVHWLRQLVSEGLAPIPTVLEETSEGSWAERERFWITKLRSEGAPLVNATDGGEGVLGHRPSAEARAKMAAAARRTRNRLGTITSAETREKIGAARRGRPLSPEHRASIGNGVRGRVVSMSERQKKSAAMRGVFKGRSWSVDPSTGKRVWSPSAM